MDRGRSWSNGDLNRSVDRLASALSARGVVAGDVVSWMLPNWVEAVIVHHAALRIGAISNPIIPIYRHSETAFILRQAGSKIVVVPRRFRNFDYPGMIDDIRADVPELQTVVVAGAAPGDSCLRFEELLEEGRADPFEAPGRDGNDIALLLYTSGTTSAPKGALHSHNTLNFENRSIIDFYGLSESDVIFMPSPVGHITGLLYGVQLPFMLGTTVVMLDIWEPGKALELISEHKCSFVVAATPFLHGILHHPSLPESDIASLRVFACGGADVPRNSSRRRRRPWIAWSAEATGPPNSLRSPAPTKRIPSTSAPGRTGEPTAWPTLVWNLTESSWYAGRRCSSAISTTR